MSATLQNRAPINYALPQRSREPIATTMLRIVNVVLLFAGCVLSCGAPFAFDAPGSDQHVGTWVFVGTLLALPVACIAALLGSAFLSAKGRHRAAQLVLLLPLADVLIFAINVAWMQIANGGRF